MIDSISQSKLGMWLRCGVQFERRYLVGDVIPPKVTARRGSATHKAADTNHKQKILSHIDMPLSDLHDCTRDEFIRLIKDEGVFIPKGQLGEKKAILNEALNQSLYATRKYQENIASTIRPVASEERITVDIGLPLPLSGTLDVITVEDIIDDIKIRGITKNQFWADRDIQASFYYLLHKAYYGEYPNGFRYDQIVTLKTSTKYVPLFTTRTEADINRLILYIQGFMDDLNAGKFRPADPDSWMCSPDWCGYYATCPYGGLKRVAA